MIESIGEIVEAGTTRFIAQCPPERLHAPPAFGTFVKVNPFTSISASALSLQGTSQPAKPVQDDFIDPFADPPPRSQDALPANTQDGTLYALVYSAVTSSLEPGRRAAAYGLPEDELRNEQPQIFDLLATQFEALHIGYAQSGRIRTNLPPRPPRLHAFVQECTLEEVCALTDTPDLLRRLLAAPGEANPDQLITTCLQEAYRSRNDDFAFLVRAGKQLANLLRDDPERLTALLRGLEP